MEYGHWSIENVGSFNTEDYAGFIYEAVEISTGIKYVGRKFFWTSRKKESNWKKYKTSSKIIKRRIATGEKFLFNILELVTNRDVLIVREIEILKKLDVLNNQGKYYNRAIYSEGCVRDEESYKNPETRKKMSEKATAHIAINGHPLQGKPHPNRGKKLPQTAPKCHVSVNNVMITDGEFNKWFPKNEPVPEGWQTGMVRKDRELTEKEKESRKLIGKMNHQKAMERYYKAPDICQSCQQIIDYSRKGFKTCSEKCHSIIRGEITRRTFNEETLKLGKATLKQNIATSKGYESYAAYSKTLIEFYKTHSNEEVRKKFNCSETQIRYICLEEDFNKHQWKLDNKNN